VIIAHSLPSFFTSVSQCVFGPTSSLSADLDKITSWSNTWNMSFNPNKSHTLTVSLKKDRLEPPTIDFVNNPLEEVLSFKLMGLTICNDLSCKIHISKLPSKASRRLDIFHCAKSFLGPPELLITCKPFGCSKMEYSSPLWAGAPTSHLFQLHAVETKAFRIIGISHREPLTVSPQADRWSFCLLPSPVQSTPPTALSTVFPHISAWSPDPPTASFW